MNVPRMLRPLYLKIRVPLRTMLGFIWRRVLFNTTFIGITGSVGKTTTKELLYAILSEHAATVKTPDNRNDRHGVTTTLLSVRRNTKFAIVEYGTSEPGRIAGIGRNVKPDIAAVISIARTHTRSFNTLEDTAKEKAEIFNNMTQDCTAIINVDDPYVCKMAQGFKGKVVRFGSSANCDIHHYAVEAIWPKRFGLRIKSGDEEQFFQTQLVGTHWVGSVVAAVSIAHACGISLVDCASAIAKVPPYTARMQPVNLPCGAILVRDEFNGSEDSFKKMVEVMEQAEAKRLVLIISDVSDRKGNTKRRQRDIGRVAAQYAQMAIFCSDHGHHALNAAIKAGMDSEHCHHVMGLRATSALMKKTLREGDLVFLKGWGTAHLSRLVFAQYGEFACWKEDCRYTKVCDVCGELKAKFNLQDMVKQV